MAPPPSFDLVLSISGKRRETGQLTGHPFSCVISGAYIAFPLWDGLDAPRSSVALTVLAFVSLCVEGWDWDLGDGGKRAAGQLGKAH